MCLQDLAIQQRLTKKRVEIPVGAAFVQLPDMSRATLIWITADGGVTATLYWDQQSSAEAEVPRDSRFGNSQGNCWSRDSMGPLRLGPLYLDSGDAFSRFIVDWYEYDSTVDRAINDVFKG